MSFIQLCNKEKHAFVDENSELAPFVPDIEVIATALCHINRFTGHVGRYSVAQHSLHVFVEMRNLLPEDHKMQLAALLHDATEAYLGDVAKPLKDLLPDYQRIEDFYSDTIDDHFGINTRHDMIKMIDKRMLKTEGESFNLDLVASEHDHLMPYDYYVHRAETTDEVFVKFMQTYYYLTDKMEKKAMHQ